MTLSEALGLHELELTRTPDGWIARSVDGPCEVIDEWAILLAIWWRCSPTCLRECDECGELSLTGSTGTRRCVRGYRSGKAKRAGCKGTMRPVTPRFTKPRPRRRTKKI